MIRTKSPTNFVSLVTAILLSAGCAGSDRPADAAVRDGILLLGNGAEPKGLDPHIVTGVPENHIITALIEGLVTYHPTDDNAAEPGVAERWEHDADYRVWTFFLRESARWTNGDPVVAGDFVYSFRRILTPDLGAEYSNMLYVMNNAEEFNTGSITDASRLGVRAIDDRTLEITLKGPTPYFLTMLQHYAWSPVHPGTVERFGGMTDRSGEWTRVGNFVGNGPFTLKEWRTNQIIKVEKNPDYWDADRVRLNEIHFLPIENINTEVNSFLAGQLHKTNEVPNDRLPSLRQNNADVLRIDPYLGTYYYRMNVTRAPMDNPKVREALNWAVNRQEIVERVTQGDQRPAHAYIPKGMGGYEGPEPLGYDPEKARALLAEAGYPGGAGFPTIDILINTSENHRRIAEAIQEMWRRELGITVTITNEEWKVYLDSQSGLNYTVSRSGWIGDYMDPITFMTMWMTGDGNNQTGWSNRQYDALLRTAMTTGDPVQHYEALRRAESILLDELPIIPIYWYTRVYLLDQRVKGWDPKLLDNRPYKYIYLEG